MRIFIATGIFHPEPGGPATYLYHLLPELQARGHDVTVLTFGDDPTDDYPYPVVRISRRQSYPARQLAYWRAARRLWPGHDVAFVHSFNIPLPANIRPAVGKVVGDPAWERATNKGWVEPGLDIDTFQRRRYGPLVEANKLQRARVARRWDHIIVPSAHRKRMVVGWGVPPERITVVYNALPGERSAPTETAAEARRRLGLPDGPLLFTAARLMPLKGIDHTLRALADLPDVRLVVAGEGPARAELEALTAELGLSDRVRFEGFVERDRLPLYFRAADYTLLYSGGEGLSHTLIESLALGTPVIARDAGGNPEVVQHGMNGLLVPYVDPAALVRTLHEAFEPGRRAALAANTSAGLERFDWAHLVEQTIDVLRAAARR